MGRFMATLTAKRLLPALALVLACAGCRRAEVTLASIPKTRSEPAPQQPEPPQPAAPPTSPPPEFATAAEGAPALKWTLPGGWTETHPGGMRYATLKPPAGSVDVSVIVLAGPAGGELANVNRWRGQIGLGEIGQAALAKARVTIRAKAGDVAVYDFSSGGEKKSRMVAALASNGDRTWFLKMLGDAPEVKTARADFNHLLQSLHFDGAN